MQNKMWNKRRRRIWKSDLRRAHGEPLVYNIASRSRAWRIARTRSNTTAFPAALCVHILTAADHAKVIRIDR